MQINLHDNRLYKSILYLGWVLFFICIFINSCSNSTTHGVKIETKEIIKTLHVDTIIKHEKVKIPTWYRDIKTEKKYLKDISEAEERKVAYQEEIDNMQAEFMFSDSIKQAELYRLATELKKFESNFEDENLKLTIRGIIGGNVLKEITPTYTIKSKKLDPQQKNVMFRMLAGGGLGNSLTFDKPLFYANIGFQNKKGNILRFSFDTEQRIMIGYDFSLFKITK